MFFSYVFLIVALFQTSRGQSIPHWPDKNETRINVCVSEWTPGVFCVGLNPANFSGYEVEVLQRASKVMGWSAEMITWECVPSYDTLLPLLQQGTCDIAMAGMVASSALLKENVTFSWPINRSALKIVIKPRQANYGYFSFFKPFDWLVWLMFVVTGIGAGFLAWGLEWYQLKRGPTAQLAPEYMVDSYDSSVKSTYVWNLVGLPLSVGYIDAKTSAGFAVYLGWGILWMVLIIYYFASIAANMTANLIQSNIQTVTDLQGRKVATWTGYVPSLVAYGINAVGLPWDDKETEMALFEAVRSGDFDALVVDDILATYYAVPDCQLAVLDGQFGIYDMSIALRPGIQESNFREILNAALVDLIETGQQEELLEKYMQRHLPECKALENTVIYFDQVAGLWILLAGVFGCAILYVVLKQLRVMQRTLNTKRGDADQASPLNGVHAA